MNKKALFFILILLSGNICLAQRRAEAPVAKSTGKELNEEENIQITELFFLGLGEKAKQNSRQAAVYFKQVLTIDPANDATLYELAAISHADGQEKEAERLIREAINKKPGNEWYWVLLSNVYKKTNNFAQLNQVFDELIKIAPNKDDYYFDKATSLLGQNKADDALKVYDLLEKKHGLSEDLADARQRVYQKQGKAGSPTEELGKVVKSDPAASGNSNAIAGDLLMKEGNFAEARNAYKKALERNSEDYHIWDNLIAIESNELDYDAVIRDGEEALTLFPSQAALYLYTGLAYAQKNNYTKAVSYLKNAAGLETEDKDRQAKIYAGLGESYNGLKNNKDSDLAHEKALQFAPDNAYALSSYANTLSLRGENLDKAALMARRSTELKPNTPSFEDTYARVLFRQKKFKDARTWIEKAIKNQKTVNAIQFDHYGDILAQSGEVELAVQQWIKAKNAGLKSEKLDRKINEKKYLE